MERARKRIGLAGMMACAAVASLAIVSALPASAAPANSGLASKASARARSTLEPWPIAARASTVAASVGPVSRASVPLVPAAEGRRSTAALAALCARLAAPCAPASTKAMVAASAPRGRLYLLDSERPWLAALDEREPADAARARVWNFSDYRHSLLPTPESSGTPAPLRLHPALYQFGGGGRGGGGGSSAVAIISSRHEMYSGGGAHFDVADFLALDAAAQANGSSPTVVYAGVPFTCGKDGAGLLQREGIPPLAALQRRQHGPPVDRLRRLGRAVGLVVPMARAALARPRCQVEAAVDALGLQTACRAEAGRRRRGRAKRLVLRRPGVVSIAWTCIRCQRPAATSHQGSDRRELVTNRVFGRRAAPLRPRGSRESARARKEVDE